MQRTHEIGVRLALGASRRGVMALVVRQGLMLAVLAVAIGLLIGYPGARILQQMLYQISPADPVTFLAVPLVLFGVTLVASYLPALRAVRVDPVRALQVD